MLKKSNIGLHVAKQLAIDLCFKTINIHVAKQLALKTYVSKQLIYILQNN